ncbi:MAG TPA: peptide-methionine (R)-S-oxide reductase MsrB [Candidatus Saccharimonadales bacterium]|nr:peptide-methionine (R)-S-oxide reductase MsrB [Candidatus Saccharimonadales bacterium]
MARAAKQINPNLSNEQKRILFDKGTEAPYSGKYLKHTAKGMYTCANCGQELFTSDTKFTAPPPNEGWPSFSDLAKNDAVELVDDNSWLMHRTEVNCANCGAHLGHLFDDGPAEAGGKHYCINSVCLNFKPEK